METTNKTPENCNCGDNCCQPKKSKLWTKIVFFIIIVAALAIVTVKLTGNNNKSEAKAAVVSTDSNTKPPCCDTTQPKICTQVQGSDNSKPCCPKAKK